MRSLVVCHRRACASLGLCFVFAVLLGGVASSLAADLVPASNLGLRVARGFRVTLFADSDMANDIYALAIDPRGNVVVTGQGYIRTLLDRNSDGVADSSIEFAQTPTGGMGLCFDGNDLMFVGDGALWRFRDTNGDGQADGPPEKLLPLEWAEHGGHSVRKGPDGSWYVIAGNETKFGDLRSNLAGSPSKQLEAGVLLRIPASGSIEPIAHGFRNPYDFDFNSDGDIFTYDSDVESDYFLPWYTPTRIYHVAPGQHHGWRLEGWKRSWPRPDYYCDTVDILASIGRGSPTGVACYRHLQFPPYYRDGLFALDWTFGKVYFLPLQRIGSTYQATPEVFLESVGTQGFAPTGVAVGYDGSLFISTGGRKSRGAVYRVQYVADNALAIHATNWMQVSLSELRAVLLAPQPLEGWSRALWRPMAERVAGDLFAEVAVDNRIQEEMRIRAIEVLTEVHGGLTPAVASACAQANSPSLRARTAWSLDMVPSQNFAAILLNLARDVAPSVRCRALEAMRRHTGELEPAMLQQALSVNLAHPDKRVRLAAALLASHLSDAAWNALWAQQKNLLLQARLTLTMALLWRTPPASLNTIAADTAVAAIAQTKSTDLQLQAVRLLILALGDYRLQNPSVEVFTAYEPAFSLQGQSAFISRIRTTVSKLFPSSNAALNFEAARLLAMVEADDPGLPAKIISFFSDRTAATADFHYLTVLSHLKAPVPTNLLTKIASAIVSLDRKLDGLQQRPKQNWTMRLNEVVQALGKRTPGLAEAMMRHPDFARPGNVNLVLTLGSERFLTSARVYFAAVQRTPNFPWSGELIDLLSALPAEEVLPLFRRQWSNVALRDRLLIELAQRPQIEDRDKFVKGLSFVQPEIVRACMSALLQLPGDTSSDALVSALRLLRRLLNEPTEQTMRAQTVALITHLTGQRFTIQEQTGDLRKVYQPVFDRINTRYPGLLRQLDSNDQESQSQWDLFYKSVPWNRGDATRGETIFNERGCQACHSGRRPVGPDLAGITSRLSPTDLFNAIIFPSRDVAPPYWTTTFETRNGETYTGLVAFESADGVIVQTGLASTVRLAEADIASRRPSSLSLMPSGLLSGLTVQSFADLYAYLKTLQPPR